MGPKFQISKPEKNTNKKTKRPSEIPRCLLPAIKKYLVKNRKFEGLASENKKLFKMCKGKQDLFNKFKKMSADVQKEVRECLPYLLENPYKTLKEYIDLFPKKIEMIIKEFKRLEEESLKELQQVKSNLFLKLRFLNLFIS